MPDPLVSVLLPARDCGAYLRPAVISLLDQTLPDFEILLIDDGTTDGSLGTLPADPRLRIRPSDGRGLVDALNTAIRHARGTYLARMDGDDIALPDRLARQIAYLEAHPEIGIAGGQVEIFTDAGPPAAGYRQYQHWLNRLTDPACIRREIFRESPIPHPSAVLRHSVMAALGGYRDCGWPEDYDLWLRAWAAGIPMGKPDGVVLRWRDGPNRYSRRDSRCSEAAFLRARAHFLARHVLTDRPAVLLGAGRYGGWLCDALDQAGAAVRAFVDITPRKVGGRKRGRPVLPPEALARCNDGVVLGAVRQIPARADIRRRMAKLGRIEGQHFFIAG